MKLEPLLQRQVDKSLDHNGKVNLEALLEQINDEYLKSEAHLKLINRTMNLMSEELFENNRAIHNKAELLHSILNSTPNPILTIDVFGNIATANQATTDLFLYGNEELIGKSLNFLVSQSDSPLKTLLIQQNNDSPKISPSHGFGVWHEHILSNKNKVNVSAEVLFSYTDRSKKDSITVLINDLSRQKEAERKVDALNAELVNTAHLAGMSEIATSVLHNVGNVLNSINISTLMLHEKINKSRLFNLQPLVELLNKNKDNLAHFLIHDEQGKHIPEYLKQLAHIASNERQLFDEELNSLTRNVSHVKSIIKTQQSISGVSGGSLRIDVENIIKDVIKICKAKDPLVEILVENKTRRAIEIICEKNKLQQILINLISNSIEALKLSTKNEKKIQIILDQGNSTLIITIHDNGIGICNDTLNKLFNFGFSTKISGHGYGLHSSILLAKEMGGKLTGSSPGVNEGATFTLALPCSFSNRKP